MQRCHWVNLGNDKYIKYHDEEWGEITKDDNKLFEMLLLESFQAGLSWECILNKRDYFREAFDNFNPNIISNYDSDKVNELLSNKNIIRNKNKISAVIGNAKIFIDIQLEYGSFANYIWGFSDNKVIYNKGRIHVSNYLSDLISLDLKKRGMKYVGTKIIYSYLQSIGVINDHERECFKYREF